MVVVGGGGAAAVAGGVLSRSPGSADSSDPSSSHITRGFKMVVPVGGTAPVGYDFSQTPPAVADLNTEAIYVSGTQLFSTSGQLAAWDKGTVPTAADCREALAHGEVRDLAVSTGRVVCFMDRNNNSGYIAVTGFSGTSITVDTAHLR